MNTTTEKIPVMSKAAQAFKDSLFNIFLLTIIIYVFFFLAGLVLVMVGKESIKEDWVRYRCNPLIMPFARLFDKDPVITFNKCLGMVANSQVGGQMAPVLTQFSGIFGILGDFIPILNNLRKFAKKFQSLTLVAFGGIFEGLQNIGTTVHYIFLKNLEVMKKHYGIFTIIIQYMVGAYETTLSMWNGPIGGFARFFCFEKNTPITLMNGDIKKIKDIHITDKLADNNQVIGTIVTSTRGVELFNYNGIIVSGNHIVKENRKWIPIKDSLNSVRFETHNIDKLYCLNTTGNRLKINNIEFCDYNEINDKKICNTIKKYILRTLNGTEYRFHIDLDEYYSSGFSHNTKIKMKYGSKSISKVKIGDETCNGTVLGTVKLVNVNSTFTDGTYIFSANNIINNSFSNNKYEWMLTSDINTFKKTKDHYNTLYHIMTSTGDVILDNGLKFLDYSESIDNDDYIMNLVLSHLNQS